MGWRKTLERAAPSRYLVVVPVCANAFEQSGEFFTKTMEIGRESKISTAFQSPCGDACVCKICCRNSALSIYLVVVPVCANIFWKNNLNKGDHQLHFGGCLDSIGAICCGDLKILKYFLPILKNIFKIGMYNLTEKFLCTIHREIFPFFVDCKIDFGKKFLWIVQGTFSVRNFHDIF